MTSREEHTCKYLYFCFIFGHFNIEVHVDQLTFRAIPRGHGGKLKFLKLHFSVTVPAQEASDLESLHPINSMLPLG